MTEYQFPQELLDQFAMHILQGMIASESDGQGLCRNKLTIDDEQMWYAKNAIRAYDWAEAMVKEREKRLQ